MQAHLIFYQDNDRLEVVRDKDGVAITMSAGFVVKTWELPDSERALLIAFLSATPIGDLNAGTEHDPAVTLPADLVLPVVRLNAIAKDFQRSDLKPADLLTRMVEHDGYEFGGGAFEAPLGRLERAGLAERRDAGAMVCVWHATADGREALGLPRGEG